MSVGVPFVCLGNIYRSPTAQGILEQKLHQARLDDAIHLDSCVTAAFNVGVPSDRAIAAASRAGYDIGSQVPAPTMPPRMPSTGLSCHCSRHSTA